MRFKHITAICLATGVLALGQDKPPAPAARKAPAAAASPVDNVIQMLKGGMSEALVIKMLQRQNKPITPSPAEMLKLQKAGVSENVINALMDPGSLPNPGPAAVPAAKEVTSKVASSSTPGLTSTTAPPGPSCPAPAAVSPAANSQKRRIAVEPFEYSTVRSAVSGIFGNDLNIGQGIRAILTAKMGQSKQVVLLERESLKKVLAEQDLGATNRIKRGTQAKVGGVTGADAMLFGDIVIFGRDDQSKASGAGGISRVPGPFGVIAGGIASANKTDKAVVGINLRLVDAVTGEVIETAEARGESKRKSNNWGAMAGTWRGAGAATSSMNSSNFAETIIGEATMDAVAKIVAFLEEKVPAIAAKSREVEGRVMQSDGCTLYLTVGGNDSVQVGDQFEVHKILNKMLDPQTKEVLDLQTVKVGTMVISSVRDKSASGAYGGPAIPASELEKPGYLARLVTAK